MPRGRDGYLGVAVRREERERSVATSASARPGTMPSGIEPEPLQPPSSSLGVLAGAPGVTASSVGFGAGESGGWVRAAPLRRARCPERETRRACP